MVVSCSISEFHTVHAFFKVAWKFATARCCRESFPFIQGGFVGLDNGVVSSHQRIEEIAWIISGNHPGRSLALAVSCDEGLGLLCLLLASIWWNLFYLDTMEALDNDPVLFDGPASHPFRVDLRWELDRLTRETIGESLVEIRSKASTSNNICSCKD